MKKLFLTLIILINFVCANGQNTPIYNWQEHLSYQSAKLILEVENTIYCATENGLYYYNKDDYTINRLSKVIGLSDIGITAISYDNENKIIIIAYENCNIDLIKDENIININDIKLKEVFGEKKVNNIIVKDRVAYLSCTFGLLLIDLEKEEIKDTYKIGESGNFVGINDCSINDTSIFAATTDGFYYADVNSSFLFDFNTWIKHPNYTGEITDITITPTELIINNSGHLFFIRHFNNTTIWVSDTSIDLYSNNSNGVITNTKFIKIQDVLIDNENTLWIADSVNSLMKFENLTYHSTVKPNGPASNSIEKINYENGTLTLLHNSEENSISKSHDLIDWKIINTIQNINCSQSKGNDTYYGSSTNGLSKIDKSENLTKYNLQNTNNIMDTSDNINGLVTDQFGNIWGTKSHSTHPLFCKTNNNWHSFNMPFVANTSTEIGEIIIDDYGQKWGILPGNGLFVYNDNSTIEDISDDQFTKITESEGNGNLPDNDVYTLVNDLDGNIWVGIKKGVCVFYSPSSVFSGYNFDSQQIIIQEGDFGQYLLESEVVYTIAVDGGNRKWIGTLGAGLYLLSEDGTEEIYHFTTENSPLLSNTILDIEINEKTAEVFITTDKGLMSFRNDATFGESVQNKITIFPNPVKENYGGYISIDGLVENANIKITDVSGNLVFDTYANGGMAVWNGKNKNGQKVGTGAYLVLSSDKYGKEKISGKILFIK